MTEEQAAYALLVLDEAERLARDASRALSAMSGKLAVLGQLLEECAPDAEEEEQS